MSIKAELRAEKNCSLSVYVPRVSDDMVHATCYVLQPGQCLCWMRIACNGVGAYQEHMLSQQYSGAKCMRSSGRHSDHPSGQNLAPQKL